MDKQLYAPPRLFVKIQQKKLRAMLARLHYLCRPHWGGVRPVRRYMVFPLRLYPSNLAG